MEGDYEPLSETLTDAQIAVILNEFGLVVDAGNIDLVRNSREEVEKRLAEHEAGKPASKIIQEVQINSLRKN